MDPITQTLTGALAAHATMSGRLGRAALLLGAVGGELPDIDVFFDPWTDPALPFQWHRHFTHALAVIPVGGLIAAAPFLLFRRWREKAGAVYAACAIGFATHGLLDNCTSYGTYLLWPFLNERTAWDVMSIIDPIFTAVLLLSFLVALIGGRAWPARLGLALGLLYIAFGFVQHGRAQAVQRQLAAARGHHAAHGRVVPTLGNLILWRSIYEHGGRLHADAVRVPVLAEARVRAGASRPQVTSSDLPSDSRRVQQVFTAFSAFADGFTAVVPADPGGSLTVGDMRYSLVTAGFEPLWGIRIDLRYRGDPVRAVGFTSDRPDALSGFWRELTDPGPEYVPLSALPHSGQTR